VPDRAVDDLVQWIPFAAVVSRGPDRVVEAANDVAAELFGDAVAVGRSLCTLVDGPPAGTADSSGPRAEAAGSSGPQVEAAGSSRPLAASVTVDERRMVTLVHRRLPDDGVLTVAVEITEWVDSANRSAFLARASAVLLEASLERADALRRAAELAVPELGELCLINLVQPDGTLRRAAVVIHGPGDGEAHEAHEALWSIAPSPRSPAYRVLASGRPEILPAMSGPEVAAITGGDTGRAEAIGGLNLASTLVVPLRARGRTLGTLSISSTAPDRYTQAEVDLAEELAVLASLAMDTAALYTSEREAKEAANVARARAAVLRRDLEQQRDRLEFLAEASLLLDSPLSQTGRLQRLADLAVRRIADWCAVHLVRGRQVEQITVAHADPAKVALVAELQREYPPDPDAEGGAVGIARSGKAQLVPAIIDEMLVAAARDAAHLELLRQLKMTSAIVVPLTVRGRSIGAITLVSAESGQRYTEADLAFAQDLASRAAIALDNARLYDEQHSIAATLQEALRPYELPSIPGMRIGARYVAQGQANEVGGDFYDVFASGSAGVWSLLIGDVCGKGARAAALTALVRHTVRAEANHPQSAEQVLRRLNTAILRQLGPAETRFCTAIYGELDVTTGSCVDVTLASGGHLPPRVLHPDGRVDVLPAGGTALGVRDDPAVAVARVRLDPGDSLVLFTDGVIEARNPDGFYGTRRLDALLAASTGCAAQALADRVTVNAVDFQGGAPRDDIAVLVMQAR
jgi:serine phosphatase RsbU (regulator of sigma subunit)